MQLDHSAFTSTDAKNVKKSVKRRWKTTSNITVSDLRSLVDFFAPAAIITGYHRGLSSPLLGTMGTAVPTSTLPQALPCTPTSTSTYSDHLACGPSSGAGTIHSPTSAVAAQHALASCQLPPATPLVVNSHHNFSFASCSHTSHHPSPKVPRVQAEEPLSAEVHPNALEASEVDHGILVRDPDSSAPVLT